jgi:arylsulfatase A-like enzyme
MQRPSTRRDFIAAVAAAPGTVRGASRRRPNVILILTDDQGYGDLGCHGNTLARTPNLDRLHAQSTRLTDFHVDPTCSPTRSALLTGLYSHRVGVWHTVMGRNFLRRDAVTMADVFRASGYRTGIFGKWHLGTNYPFRPIDRGFDRWVGHGNGGIGTSSDYWDNQKLNDTYYRNGVWEKFSGFSTDVFFAEAMRFIGESGDQPFFLYLPTNVPHSPLNIPSEWLKPWLERAADAQLARFYASIERIDTNIGRLTAFLAKRSLLDDTILIFMTDNGGTAGVRRFNAGMRGGKGQVFDGGHRVPCFIRWPDGGIEAGRDIDRLTAHLDVLPTLIELCGLKRPGGVEFDGVSLARLLRNRGVAWPDRTLLVESQRIQHPRIGKDCAMMTGRWRLVNGQDLYDMPADPGQRQPVANPEVVRELRGRYEKLWKDISKHDGEFGRPVIGSGRQDVVWLAADERFAPIEMVPWDQPHVRKGNPIDGFWAAETAVDGDYEFAVRRWPREVDVPMTSGLPEIVADGAGRIGTAPPGEALPLVKARLRAGDRELVKPVPEGASEVVFRVPLKRGPLDIRAWLYDAAGDGSRGAYNVYARRLR